MAREKLGLDPEKLGRAIGEKTSTLKQIEREELVPDQEVARKIRRILKVDILTRESIKDTTASPPPKGNPTIGDLMKLKEKKEPDATH
jgi:putative transcription factor